jgi:competence protein ComEC
MEALLEEEGANAVSLVLELRYGRFSALLTGDAPTAVEEAILPGLKAAEVQVLKVGHHGSRTSTSPELLERISPEVALISVGARNRYGHPDPGILRRLEKGGVRVLRTDEEGTLVLRARRDGRYQVHGTG